MNNGESVKHWRGNWISGGDDEGYMGENMLLYYSVLGVWAKDCQQNMIKHRQWTSCLHACIYSILAALETLCCSHLTCVLCILPMCLILVSGIMRYHFHFDFLSLNLHLSIQAQRVTIASSGRAFLLFYYHGLAVTAFGHWSKLYSRAGIST